MAGLTRLLVPLLAVSGPAAAQVGGEAPPIADNSFLIEEAYNQEAGVVQHIGTLARPDGGGSLAYSFTQEWPLGGRRKQASYTLPVVQADGHGTGLGDIALHFRYQLAGDGGAGVHLAPRATLILPTGDERRDRGAGGTGFQGNLPLSVRPLRTLALHANAGLTWTPGAKNPAGQTARTLDTQLGGSAVWLVRPAFNFLCELLWVSTDRVVGPGTRVRESGWLVSPGLRGAVNFPGGTQLVPGAAYTFSFDTAGGEDGLFLYLSVEHSFRRAGT